MDVKNNLFLPKAEVSISLSKQKFDYDKKSWFAFPIFLKKICNQIFESQFFQYHFIVILEWFLKQIKFRVSFSFNFPCVGVSVYNKNNCNLFGSLDLKQVLINFLWKRSADSEKNAYLPTTYLLMLCSTL